MTAPTGRPEVHVGDVGTKYRVRVTDENGPFDPSDATTKQLIFKLPGNITLVKDADVESDSPATEWFLVYIVEADAGAGSPPGDFHANPGLVHVQAYLEWADGRRFHSDIVNVDEDFRLLKVHPNLN